MIRQRPVAAVETLQTCETLLQIQKIKKHPGISVLDLLSRNKSVYIVLKAQPMTADREAKQVVEGDENITRHYLSLLCKHAVRRNLFFLSFRL